MQRAGYNNVKHMMDLEPRSTISATTVSRAPRPARALLVARGFNDLHEAARVEAGASYKGTVNVWLAHELSCVLWLHAPAVLNTHPFGRRIIGHRVQSMADERVGFLCLSGRRIAAGADGPDRFIRNHRFLQFLRAQTSEAAT